MARGAEKRNTVNEHLKDVKMGHNPHSNPRDVRKSPEVVVRFQNRKTSFPKRQNTGISGITGKIEKCSMKFKHFD